MGGRHVRLYFLLFPISVIALNCFLSSGPTFASRPSKDVAAVVTTFVQQNCYECHSNQIAEGGLNFDEMQWDLDDKEVRLRWIRIYDRIANGEMPPDQESSSKAQLGSLLPKLFDAIHSADLTEVRKQGRGSMRRLNRREYEDNLRDLLHLPYLDVRDVLPADREAHHTNKSAPMLDITRVQMSAYLRAADVALRQSVASDVKRRTPSRYFALATNMFPKAIDHAGRESTFYAKHGKMIPLTSADLRRIRKDNTHDKEMEVAIFRSAGWPYYGYPEGFVAKEAGEYAVRFHARSVRQGKEFRLLNASGPQPMTFRARQPSLADVSGDVRATGGLIDVQPQGQVYETMVRLEIGETLEYSLLG